MYQVFYRTWWRFNEKGEKIPHVGRKTVIGYVKSEEQARSSCKNWNDRNEDKRTGKKAEYSSKY